MGELLRIPGTNAGNRVRIHVFLSGGQFSYSTGLPEVCTGEDLIRTISGLLEQIINDHAVVLDEPTQ
jgi:hypothetical protein